MLHSTVGRSDGALGPGTTRTTTPPVRGPAWRTLPGLAAVARLQRLAGNHAMGHLLRRTGDSAVVQRHSSSALAQQVEESEKEERAGIQRHVDPFRGHEPFNEAPLPPGTRQWRLAEIVPDSEVRRYKRALTDMVEHTVADPAAKATLRRRILAIKVIAAPCTKGAAESEPGLVKIDPAKGEFYTAQFQPHVDAIRGTVIHELFHAASINHEGKTADMVTDADKGFQGASTTVVPVREGTQETLDEAMTDWLAHEVFTRLYPGGTYTSAYFVKAPKVLQAEAEGIGQEVAGRSTQPYVASSKEQIPLVLEALRLSPAELKRMYLHDHAALGRHIDKGDTRQRLKDRWEQHKKQRFREQSPLSTNPGLAAVVTDMIAEYREELSQCETPAEQDTFLTIKLKQQHGLDVRLREKQLRGLRPLPATPGVDAALATMPPAGDSWRTDDGSATLNRGLVDKAIKHLRVERWASQLAFVLVTARDGRDTPLNQYPTNRRYGPVPGVPYPVGNHASPYAATKHFGGGGYEMAIKTAFLNEEHADSYPHYLHEVGHFKQDLELGYNERTLTGRKLKLLDYHNILSHEIGAGHFRTKYATESPMKSIIESGKKFIDVKRDVESDPVAKRMFAEIEEKLEGLPAHYQELIRRNLTYEYFTA